MNKIYAIAPLIGLGLFAGIYSQHAHVYEMRLAETKRIEDESKKAKVRAQQAAQVQALAEATTAAERRKQERAVKDRLEEAHRQARLDAEDRHTTALAQEKRLRIRLDRLRVELAGLTDAVNRSEERKRELLQEDEFLGDYVQQAEVNRSLFYQLLENLELSERNRTAGLPSPKTPPR